MRVFLTGGTGFVGSHILSTLVAQGHSVRALARERQPEGDTGSVEWVTGDVRDAATLKGHLDGIDAVINVVGIIEEHPSKGITFDAVHFRATVNLVDAARAAGVRRFVQMSANGARAKGVSGYQTSKWRGEEAVRAAGFDHCVIFRPAIVFGDPGPRNPEFSKLLATTLVKPFPVLPVPGDGRYQLQPISVGEVATAFVKALDLPEANGQSYCCAGLEKLSFDEILDRIAVAIALSPKPKVHQPLWLVRPAVRAATYAAKLPITSDQLEMLVEGNTCDSSAFYRDFGVTYTPYTPENLGYLRRYVRA
ncbi:MAG TPA: complex I NDUFA9 subunit family protein [Rhodothermales bacterium]